MSASTEKKMRQAAREAGTDKKTLAMEKEAKEKAKKNRRWTIGTIAVAVVVVLVLLLNSNLVYKTTAYTVGSKDYTVSEVSYRYANQYHSFANQYGQYASMFGLDTSNGIAGLDKQNCPMIEDGSWKDYFLDAAKKELQQEAVLVKYAAEQGITLDSDELAQIDTAFEGLDEQAKAYGYGNGNKMLAANYGTGVNKELIHSAYEASMLANKAGQALSDSFTYTDEQLQEKYQSFEGTKDYFDYAYCYVSAEKVETTNADGETSNEVTEETLAAAEAKANAIAETYKSAAGDEPAVRLNNAAASEDETSSLQTHVQGSSIPASEWMRDSSRQAGDITVEPDAGGCYVVVFLSRDDNHYNTVNVRHILVKAEADADGVYTDEAKEAAKARAEEILAEYESGDKTEESFAALAEQYSEDTGSNTKGGLYENVAKNQMVEEFNDFCFDTHKAGDTGIVYGTNGSYAGYHVIYFSGEGEMYDSVLADNALRSEDLNSWMEEAEAANPTKESFGMKFVG